LSFISYKATCATKDHHGDAKNKTSCAWRSLSISRMT
jgi:hypothetical protein